MDAGSLVFALLALIGGAALLVFRERLGERALRRGAPLGTRLYVLAGVLLVVYGAVTLVVNLL